MAVTPIYVDNPRLALARPYIAGLALYTTEQNLDWTDGTITFYDPILGVDWTLETNPVFYEPTSNSYTLDHAMDFTNSYARIGGVPVPAGCYVTFGRIINEERWWVGLQPLSILTTPPHLLRLPCPPDYWYPLQGCP